MGIPKQPARRPAITGAHDIRQGANGGLDFFPVGDFRIALAECPNFPAKWTSHLLREVRHARAQVERQSLRNAGDRILHYIETECPAGQLILSQSKKAWVAEFGLTHEALYRALANLARQGILRVEGALVALAARGDPPAG